MARPHRVGFWMGFMIIGIFYGTMCTSSLHGCNLKNGFHCRDVSWNVPTSDCFFYCNGIWKWFSNPPWSPLRRCLDCGLRFGKIQMNLVLHSPCTTIRRGKCPPFRGVPAGRGILLQRKENEFPNSPKINPPNPLRRGNKKDVETLFLRLTLIYLLSKIYFFINLTLETWPSSVNTFTA